MILDSWQVWGRGKQYKWLIHLYLTYEYEWINIANLSYTKQHIIEFEDRKALEAEVVGPTRKATKNKLLQLLIV